VPIERTARERGKLGCAPSGVVTRTCKTWWRWHLGGGSPPPS
jgi:hypothetical protein